MEGGEDAVEEFARDCDLSQLEDDRAGVTDDAGADLDESGLQARQRPGRDLIGRFGGFRNMPRL